MTQARVLADKLVVLLRTEQGAMADFLVALADFDRRRGWEELGYRSLFDFLRRDLRLSEGAASYRKVAAELVQEFPEVVDAFRDGQLCITTVPYVANVLTPLNRHEVLPKFFGLSRREAMALAAAINPLAAAPRRDVVTALRVPMPLIGTSPGTGAGASEPGTPLQPAETDPAPSDPLVPPAEPPPPESLQPAEVERPVPLLFPRPPRRDAAEPLTADLSRLHVTVSTRFLAKLASARAALSHARRGATAEEILEAGLDLLLERHEKRKGLAKKPLKQPRPARPETLTAAVKREVWKRDGGRCSWPLESGGVCGSTDQLEFDERVPRALGGLPTKENVRVLCRFHNILAARLVFGDKWMSQFTREGRSEAAASLRQDSAPVPQGAPAQHNTPPGDGGIPQQPAPVAEDESLLQTILPDRPKMTPH